MICSTTSRSANCSSAPGWYAAMLACAASDARIGTITPWSNNAEICSFPDLCRAVQIAVPLLDMLRYHRFLIARLWVPEYGDPDQPDDFGWLHAYSPYHRVVDGTCYPAVLLTTAEGDSRVDPMHARKMSARLQAATSCGDERPVLLRIEPKAGHGQGKPVSKQADELADVLGFFDWQLASGTTDEHR